MDNCDFRKILYFLVAYDNIINVIFYGYDRSFNMNEIKRKREEAEIDLLEIVHLLLRKAWIILICFISGAIIAGGYTKLMIIPQYTASSMIYILGSTTSIFSMADIQLGTELTGDFTTLAKSRPSLENVIEELELDMTYSQLSSAVHIENLPNTHILKISVTNSNPELARDISNAMAESTANTIAEVMVTDKPSIAEKAITPKAPSSPNLFKNIAKGALVGAVLAIAIIILFYLMDDTIKTEDDVKKYLQINTLASIPLEKTKKNQRKSA